MYGHHQADYKTKTVYTELPATGTWLTMQPLNSELHYIHYMGTETEQQNVPIRIRCSQWWVRDTTMWLSSTSAASSTITANKITEHTNKDQMFAVVSRRHDNVALHRTSAVSLLVTAKRITEHTNKDQVSQWRVRDTTMWLCRAPATNSTVTAPCTHTHTWFCCLFLS
jgi:hypothetical protein